MPYAITTEVAMKGDAAEEDPDRVRSIFACSFAALRSAVRVLSALLLVAHSEATIVFRIEGVAQRYHVPMLLSPFGYSMYRGS
jgi:hypothetical protein